MADRFDVAGRLSEGRVAIERTQAYVHACHVLGYHHPDLTAHPSQLRDWFDSEDGLNLLVLDRDCGQLRAAGQAVWEGLRIAQGQVGELTAAWTGSGGEAAVAFLQRHCDAAAAVTNEVRAAAQRCESLRDNLWHLLDSKVGTAIAIDDRSQAQRVSWLAAAAVVTSGTVERSTAEETVRVQVMPYVDNDIRGDWLAAMRSSLTAFGTAYDMVNDRMAAAPATLFEFPGDLGPTVSPPPLPSSLPPLPSSLPAPPVVASAPAVTLPASVAPTLPGSAPAADPAPSTPVPADRPAVPPAPAAPALPDPASALGSGGPGAGGLGSDGLGPGGLGGLGGLASRIVDALGGLLGPEGAGFDDPAGLDPFSDPLGDDSDDDPFHPGDEHDEHDEHDEPGAPEEPGVPEESKDVAEQQLVPDPADAPPLPGPSPLPEPASVPVPPAAAPAVTPAPATDGSTPCEIAADQVPQAGL